MSSHIRIGLGRPFSVFTEDGRPVSVTITELIIPFDGDDNAAEARQGITVQALGGLPPGFGKIALAVVPGEVIREPGELE